MAQRSVLLSIVIAGISVSAVQAGEPAGWRGDGSGRFGPAPAKWGLDDDARVVWKAELPDWSNASPVVVKGKGLVGERVLVCAEPSELLCFAFDGEKRWQRSNEYMDTVTSDERRERIRRDTATHKKLQGELKPIDRAIRDIKRTMRTLRKRRDKKGAGADGKADPNAPSMDELKVKLAEQEKLAQAIHQKIKPLDVFVAPRKHGATGYTTPTPVSDGNSVWAAFGTGVVSSYTLEGKRRWIRYLEEPRRGHGHSASPVLVDGKLLVHINDLVALDPATGKELWRAKARSGWGTPVPMKVGSRTVVVTPSGDVVDVADGKILADKLGRLDYCAPIVHGNVAYFIEHGGKAQKIEPADGNGVKVTELWTTQPPKDRYYASPVYHDGLLYSATRKGELVCIDAADGKVVYTEKLDVGRGTMYSSLVVAERTIFATHDNGVTIVFKPGRVFQKIGRNKLEKTRACPFVYESRIYFRGMRHLWVIDF